MNKNRTYEPKTEYEKLHALLDQYEIILHPDLFNAIKMQIGKAYDELKAEAFMNAKISDEALQLESMLNNCRSSIESYKEHPQIIRFMKKNLYKKLLNLLKDKNE